MSLRLLYNKERLEFYEVYFKTVFEELVLEISHFSIKILFKTQKPQQICFQLKIKRMRMNNLYTLNQMRSPN